MKYGLKYTIYVSTYIQRGVGVKQLDLILHVCRLLRGGVVVLVSGELQHRAGRARQVIQVKMVSL